MVSTKQIINSFKQIENHAKEIRVPIASEMYLPNHSGDHSAGKVLKTPVNDTSIVNKSYCDGNRVAYIYFNHNPPTVLTFGVTNSFYIQGGASPASATKSNAMMRAGSITGVTVNYDITNNGGTSPTVFLEVMKNGVAVWSHNLGTGNVANDVVFYATQDAGTDTFAAGDIVNLQFRISGAGTTATFDNIYAHIEIVA